MKVIDAIIESRSLCLAPERYISAKSDDTISIKVEEVYELIKTNILKIKDFAQESNSVTVLDVGHAKDGFLSVDGAVINVSEVNKHKHVIMMGDIIISRLRPYLRQVALVDDCLFDDTDIACVSTEFYVFRPKADLPMIERAKFVIRLLSNSIQEILASSVEGSHHPRFRPEVIFNIDYESIASISDVIAMRFLDYVEKSRDAERARKILESEYKMM